MKSRTALGVGFYAVVGRKGLAGDDDELAGVHVQVARAQYFHRARGGRVGFADGG